MLSMVEYVHQRVLAYDGEIAVDFTMGNGYDTYFLANHFSQVYAFDIQKEALIHTQKRLFGYDNVTYILDNHKNMEYYINSFDVGIFNLGYLPRSSSPTTTMLSSTKQAVEKALEYVQQALFIVVYPGHEEGSKESVWIDEYVQTLDTYQYNVSMFKMMNKRKAPYVIEIEKR